jgi:hypothetical protein
VYDSQSSLRRWLRRLPQRDVAKRNLCSLHNVVTFRLEPLGYSLTPRQWNQATKYDSATGFPLHRVVAYAEAL